MKALQVICGFLGGLCILLALAYIAGPEEANSPQVVEARQQQAAECRVRAARAGLTPRQGECI